MEIFLVPPLISQMPAAELGNEAVLRHPISEFAPSPGIVLVGQLNAVHGGEDLPQHGHNAFKASHLAACNLP